MGLVFNQSAVGQVSNTDARLAGIGTPKNKGMIDRLKTGPTEIGAHNKNSAAVPLRDRHIALQHLRFRPLHRAAAKLGAVVFG